MENITVVSKLPEIYLTDNDDESHNMVTVIIPVVFAVVSFIALLCYGCYRWICVLLDSL
jgi:hypothetical protein